MIQASELYTSPISGGVQFESWQHSAPEQLTLGPDEWHVWAIDHRSASTGLPLSGEEWNVANGFRVARDRDAFVSTRVALRHLLAAYTDATPQSIEIIHGAQSKPRLAHHEIHFNVSHSGGKSLLAFARSEIGVDLEQIRPIPEMETIARDSFAPGEYRQWGLLTAEQRERAFFLGWTRKEAYVKALGEGLHIPFDTFEVSLHPESSAEFVNLPNWTLYDLTLPAYAAALAIGGSGHSYRAWNLDLALMWHFL